MAAALMASWMVVKLPVLSGFTVRMVGKRVEGRRRKIDVRRKKV
jgi:hypothetical protein